MVKRFLGAIALLIAALYWIGVRTHERADMSVAVFWIAVFALLTAGVLHLVVNVWLTPWKVEHTGTTVVRVHRRSGAAEVLTDAGWRPLSAPVTASAPPGAPASER